MADRPILFSGPMVRALLAGAKTQTRRVIDPQPKLAPHHEPIRVEKRGERGWVWMVHTDRPAYQFATGDWRAPYAVGDRLYVREAWRVGYEFESTSPRNLIAGAMPVIYEADAPHTMTWLGRFRQGMHMPRWASRLTLIVTDVRVQRLQDISEDAAIAEGVIRQDPTPADEEWNRQWSEDQGYDPEPLQPVWLAPGTRQGFGSRPNDPKWGPTPEFAYRLLWDSLNADRGFGWSANPWIVAYSFTTHHGNIDQIARAA